MGVRFPVNEQVAKEAARFLVVGLANTALTLAIIFVLLRFGSSLLTANIIGYGTGFINSFVWNRRWTFRSSGDVWRETMVYSVVWVVCYLLQMVALLLSARWLGLSDILSTLIAMLFFTGPNYLGNRLFTFRADRAA